MEQMQFNEREMFKTLLYQFIDECPSGQVNVTPGEIQLINNNEVIKVYNLSMLRLSQYDCRGIANEVGILL